jgi:hypothetical protein
MGPGRWGSRGDIKMGVNVTYADISNAAVLIEIARRKENYLPDLSFGTHFFQDLVESNIRYIPLYPDDEGIVFDERFLTRTENILSHLLPEYAHLGDVLRVIDVPQVTRGQVLRILMNADLDEAVGILVPPESAPSESLERATAPEPASDQHWRWRLHFAERLAAELDGARYGVIALYIIGSTKNATAGPGSDIDLLVHFGGSPAQKTALEAWFQGWNLSLAEMNYLRTGYRTEAILDIHFLTDEDFAQKTSFAHKVGAVTDAARPLTLKSSAGTAGG